MNFVVRQIKPELCSQWFLYKHYAKRKPNVSYAFGIYDNNGILVGVCSYSRPMSHTLVRGAFNGEYQKNFLELNRLVVNEGLPRNTLSFFVSVMRIRLKTIMDIFIRLPTGFIRD